MKRALTVLAFCAGVVFAARDNLIDSTGLSFNGINNSVDISSIQSYGSKSISYTVWICPTSSMAGDRAIIVRGKNGSSVSIGSGVSLGITNGRVWIGGSSGSDWDNAFVNTLVPNRWYHLAAIYHQDEQTIKLYIDGQLDTIVTGLHFLIDGEGYKTFIGKNHSVNDQYFSGIIDNITIWDKAISDSEIRDAKNGTLTGKETGLLAYFNFSEGAGNVTYDKTGNHYLGTLGDTSMHASPTWITVSHTLPTNQLVASWTFDSSSGKTFYDVTGHGYDAIGSGDSIGTAGGLAGRALNCLGSGFDVPVNNSVTNFALNNFTIETWIYSYSPLTQGGYISIFDNTRTGNGDGIRGGYALAFKGNGIPYLGGSVPDGSAWIEVNSDSILFPNRWYQLSATYDGSQMKFYVNGRLTGQTSYTGSFMPNPNQARIGCQYMVPAAGAPQVRDWFNGKIDELKLYNYALTPDIILSHYNELKPPTPPPDTQKVIASWTFDSSSGKTFYDVTGHGYDAVGSGDSIRISQDGISGKALECRGVASNSVFNTFDIEVKNSLQNFNLKKLTVEAWIYSYVNLNDPGSLYNQRSIFNFVTFGLEGSGITGGYNLQIFSDGKPLHSWSTPEGGSWPSAKADSMLLPMQWYHLVATRDSSAAILYLNGKIAAKVVNVGPYKPSGHAARIGCAYQVTDASNGRTCMFFNGKIDELKLYNYALTPDIILSHYNELKPTPPPDTSKVVASWTFDSSSGKTYYDVTGHGYDAVGSGDSIRISPDGISGKTLECRGAAADTVFNTFDIKVSNSIGKFNFPKFTIEGWVYSYVNLVNPGSFYNVRSIFEYASVGMEGSGLATGYMIGVDDNGKLYLSLGNSNGWKAIFSDSIILPNRWYHVAATYDNVAMKLFINGLLRAQQAKSDGYQPTTMPAIIGAEYQITGTGTRTRRFFNGKIDELKLYNYALDAQTIKQHYQALKPSDDPPFKINFGMKTVYCNPGDTVWMPIYLTNYEKISISSCQFNIRIDTSKLQLLTLSKDSGLIKNWELFNWNAAATDSIKVAMAGTVEHIDFGEGELVRGCYRVKPTAHQGDTCYIRLSGIEIDEKNDPSHLIAPNSVPGKIILKQISVLYGDVTGDKQVTITDARDILSFVVGQFTLPDSANHPHFTIVAADVTGNGLVTSYDAALVFQYSLGLLSKFPVEHGEKTFVPRFASAFQDDPRATLAITLASQGEEGGMKFNLIGTNLKGFSAGEFNVEYNSAITNIGNGSVNTALPAATLFAKTVQSKRLIKIALATKCNVTTNEPVVLATITLPPNATTNPSDAFSLITALINEGKIPTNIPSGSIAGVVDENAALATVRAPRIAYLNGILHISGDPRYPVRVQLFTLNGRLVENRVFQNKGVSNVRISLNNYRQGAYVYRVAFGVGEVKTGKVIVKK